MSTVSLAGNGPIWGRIPTFGTPMFRACPLEITTLRLASFMTACTLSGPPMYIVIPTPVLNLAVILAGGSPYLWKTFPKSKLWLLSEGDTPLFTLGMSTRRHVPHGEAL